MTSPARILLVDDHVMFREGVRRRLEGERDLVVVGEASSADEALALMESCAPSIVVVDIRLPGKSGIELTRILRRQWPQLKIVILSGYDFDQYVRSLARVGIEGYLLKDAPQDELVTALHEIAAGGAVLPPRIASKVMRSYSSGRPRPERKPVWELTVRELEILEYLYQGLKNAEIAERLEISSRTVETHVGRILAKLGADGRTEAVRLATERGLIK